MLLPNCYRCLKSSDSFNFNEHLLGEFLYGHGRAGRVGGGEMAGINLVHGNEEAHIGKENGGFNHIVHSHACLGKNGLGQCG